MAKYTAQHASVGTGPMNLCLGSGRQVCLHAKDGVIVGLSQEVAEHLDRFSGWTVSEVPDEPPKPEVAQEGQPQPQPPEVATEPPEAVQEADEAPEAVGVLPPLEEATPGEAPETKPKRRRKKKPADE